MSVHLSHIDDARTVLFALYRNSAASPPRLLAAGDGGLPGDPATFAGARAIAAWLHRSAEPDAERRRSTGRDMIDTDLGSTLPAAPALGRAPVAVLQLAADSGQDVLAQLTDNEWGRVVRGLLHDLGQPRWPLHHPWMALRAADGVRLIVNTRLPHGNLDQTHDLAETARLRLGRTRSVLAHEDAPVADAGPPARAGADTVVIRRHDSGVVTAHGGDHLAAGFMTCVGLRRADRDQQHWYRSEFGEDAEGPRTPPGGPRNSSTWPGTASTSPPLWEATRRCASTSPSTSLPRPGSARSPTSSPPPTTPNRSPPSSPRSSTPNTESSPRRSRS